LRTKGTNILLAACREAGVRRLIARASALLPQRFEAEAIALPRDWPTAAWVLLGDPFCTDQRPASRRPIFRSALPHPAPLGTPSWSRRATVPQ